MGPLLCDLVNGTGTDLTNDSPHTDISMQESLAAQMRQATANSTAIHKITTFGACVGGAW